jgi:spore coat protein H
VAVRLKGNGTFSPVAKFGKPSFKIDLNKYVKGQKIAGVSTLNLHNNLTDASWMNEVLAYRLYRDAGTPAPRTAYARVYVTVPGSMARTYQGLYSLVENVDTNFTDEYYKTQGGAIFKPVTTTVFHDDGKNWSAYNQIYDPKTEVTPAETGRVMEFANLVTRATDQVFAARFAEFLDVDAFARHMAVLVWIANPDSVLSQGQNFYLFLHPTSKKFTFIPWDQDHSFGQFSPWRSPQSQQQLDIMHPWSPGSFPVDGQGRFLERVFAQESFRRPYLATLAELTRTLAQPERMSAQITTLTSLLSPIVAEEPVSARVDLFKQALGEQPFPRPINANVPLIPIRVFLKARHASVEAQLRKAGVK